MADLPLDQSRVLARQMLRLHRDFRERHRLPPLPTGWTLEDHLQELRPRSSLTDPALLRSRTRLVGGGLNLVRRIAWEIVKPLFYRQAEVNRDVILALEALARDREQSRHVHHVLSQRISELETAVAGPGRRDE
jgi:hypothetical protein